MSQSVSASSTPPASESSLGSHQRAPPVGRSERLRQRHGASEGAEKGRGYPLKILLGVVNQGLAYPGSHPRRTHPGREDARLGVEPARIVPFSYRGYGYGIPI